MPYTKQTWTDEVPSVTPVKFQIVDDVAGQIASSATIEIVTPVTPGSPLNAAHFNYMETGIETAQSIAEAAISKSIATEIGQFLYSIGAGVWAALSKPAVNSFLKITDAGVFSWEALSTLLAIVKRQGGSANDWSSAGVNNYTPTVAKIQTGVVNISVVAGFGTVTVTFPEAFSNKPVVLVSKIYGSGPSVLDFGIGTVTASSVVISFIASSGTATIPVQWIAIGPQ